MRNFLLLSLILGGPVAQAKNKEFKIKETETKYYYPTHSKEAAEAALWKSALEACKVQGGIPIHLKQIHIIEDKFRATATGDFECLEASEIE